MSSSSGSLIPYNQQLRTNLRFGVSTAIKIWIANFSITTPEDYNHDKYQYCGRAILFYILKKLH
jgi:hypothetical protein